MTSYSLQTIMENIVRFLMNDLVRKYIVPVIFILLVLDVFHYILSSEDKKESLLTSFKNKFIGFILLILLPVILIAGLQKFESITGIKTNVDTSIVQRVASPDGQTQGASTGNTSAAQHTKNTSTTAKK